MSMQFLFEQDQLYFLENIADEPKVIYIASDALLDADMAIEVTIAQERSPELDDIEEWDVDDELEDDEDDEFEDDEDDEDYEELDLNPDQEPMQTSLRISVVAMHKKKAFYYHLALQDGNPISPLYVYGIVTQFLDKFNKCQVHERPNLLAAVSIFTLSEENYLKNGNKDAAHGFTEMIKHSIEDMKKFRHDKKAGLN